MCGEADDGRKAVERAKELKPDIVLLDVYMPVLNGVGAAYEIRQISPCTKIVFFTIHDSVNTLAAARLLGVDGFVSKSTAGIELIATLKRLLPDGD